MTPREAEQLIQDLFDGEIPPSDFARLEMALTESPEMRELYREAALLQTGLVLHAEGPAPAAEVIPIEAVLRRRQRRSVAISLLATAALLSLLAITLRLILAPDPVPSYYFHTSPDSRYQVTPPVGFDGELANDRLPVGSVVQLAQGTLELRLPDDVRGVISAPSTFTMASDAKITFAEGTAWFFVPQGAEGFQVTTPKLRAVDLGTEFGIISVPGSTEEVHVLAGAVAVEALQHLRKNETVTAGQARQVGPAGRLKKIAVNETVFQKQVPGSLPYLHFRFDEVDGKSLAIEGDHPSLGSITNRLKQSDARPAASRLVAGRFGKALSFDGLGDVVKTDWPGVYGTSPLTVACWARTEGDPNYGGFVSWGVSKQDTRTPHQWKVLLAPRPGREGSGELVFRCAWGKNDQLACDVNPVPGQWHHFAVVFSGGSPDDPDTELRFYMDGMRIQARSAGMITPPARPTDFLRSTPLWLGHGLSEVDNPEQKFFEGALDELYIIEGALSDRQIRDLYRHNAYAPNPLP